MIGVGVLILPIVSNQRDGNNKQDDNNQQDDNNKQDDNQQDDDIIIKIAILPPGIAYESYYFILNETGTLKCFVGRRMNDNIKNCNFLESVTNADKTKISDIELQSLMNMANELEEKGCGEKPLVFDSWDVALLYNGKVYEMVYCNEENSEEFMNLTNKIIELSPIHVDFPWA
jgi:hypothetical protein